MVELLNTYVIKNTSVIYIFLKTESFFFYLVLFHSTTTLIHDEDIGSIFWIRMTEPICKLSINETKQSGNKSTIKRLKNESTALLNKETNPCKEFNDFWAMITRHVSWYQTSLNNARALVKWRYTFLSIFSWMVSGTLPIHVLDFGLKLALLTCTRKLSFAGDTEQRFLNNK